MFIDDIVIKVAHNPGGLVGYSLTGTKRPIEQGILNEREG
jgi:hypothetical protein